MLVSSTLAVTHIWLGSIRVTIGWPGWTVAPTPIGVAITSPSTGAWTSTRVSPAPRKPILGVPFWAVPIWEGRATWATTSPLWTVLPMVGNTDVTWPAFIEP